MRKNWPRTTTDLPSRLKASGRPATSTCTAAARTTTNLESGGRGVVQTSTAGCVSGQRIYLSIGDRFSLSHAAIASGRLPLRSAMDRDCNAATASLTYNAVGNVDLASDVVSYEPLPRKSVGVMP